MGYDTWKTTDFEHERKCAIEEADEKNRRDAAADLFDLFALGDEVAIDEVMDMLDDTGRWQDVIEALRAAYYRPGESHADKALRVLLAYEAAMDDVCLRIVEGPAHMGEPVLPPKAQGVPEGWKFERESGDRITIDADGLGFYVARMDAERIADIMLYALAQDLLPSAPDKGGEV